MKITISPQRRRELLALRAQYLQLIDEILIGMHKINCGEAQSYTINSLQLNRRNLTISDLEKEYDFCKKRLGEIEDELNGITGHIQARNYIPTDF